MTLIELLRYKEALEIFESALNTFQIELSVRYSRNSERRNDEAFEKFTRKTVITQYIQEHSGKLLSYYLGEIDLYHVTKYRKMP